jgi:Asp-tRNA(Asn)/Glu-tRNA(Gln) amidotransferase C subunit
MISKEQLISGLKMAIPILKDDKIPEEFFKTINLLTSSGEFELDRERLNILLSYWRLPPMESGFFNHYFEKNVKSLEDLKSCIEKFVKDALWHFGDLEIAYGELSQEEDVEEYFKEHSFDIDEFKKRLPWNLVTDIDPTDRGYLGYVSGERPKKQIESIGFAEAVISEIEDNKEEYKSLDSHEVAEKVYGKLANKFPDLRARIEEFNDLRSSEIPLFTASNLEKVKDKLATYKKEVEEIFEKVKTLKKIGIENQEHYLRNIESTDVYVATSMRDDREYIDMFHFVQDVFKDPDLAELNLRYFDPTLCYCDSRIDKGIIECLLVRSSKVTIYCAQEGDTFGKDSELAATLAQGKPVIVYVPEASKYDDEISSIEDKKERAIAFEKRKQKLDKRAQTFKEFHPLGLQVGLYDGVARGVIVVRRPNQCSKILKGILTVTTS